MSFNEAVAEWLRTQHVSVREVVSVYAYGSDWAGDTEGGFHSECDVSIEYLDAEGAKGQRYVEGEEMGSLWNFVMQAWPR